MCASAYKPETCNTRYIPDIWEKSNIVPSHKDADKQLIKN